MATRLLAFTAMSGCVRKPDEQLHALILAGSRQSQAKVLSLSEAEPLVEHTELTSATRHDFSWCSRFLRCPGELSDNRNPSDFLVLLK